MKYKKLSETLAAKRSRLRRSDPEVLRKHNEANKAWRAKHPEHHKKWRDANKDRQREYGRLYAIKYRAEHSEHIIAYKRSYRARGKNRERELALGRKWYRSNSAKLLLNTKRWKKRNYVAVLDYNARRRANKLAATTEDCTAKTKLLRRERFCHYCCGPLAKGNRAIDHVIPLARGGKHCPDNLVASCRSCNSSKGKKFVHEWTWKEAA